MRRNLPLLFVMFVVVPSQARAQGDPIGPEFRVNTYTTNRQSVPDVASDGSGNFVVVWSSDTQDGSGYGVFGQRYDSSGLPLGPEFRVNTNATGYQGSAAVAADPSGNFVVVWRSGHTGVNDVFGQRFASTGAPLGPEFRVPTYVTSAQVLPAVAADAAGFVVVWMSDHDGSGAGIFGQRYASTGSPLGPEFRVNTHTTGTQTRPDVASDASGNVVVVWESAQDPGTGIFGQRYASTGIPLGPEFRVNTYTTASQIRSAVASDAAGNFVVVWESLLQDGSSTGIFSQRYSNSGAALGPEFAVNTYTPNTQVNADVDSDALGNFVVTWGSYTQDGSAFGVFGRRYASTGTPLSPEFRVNTYTTGYQITGAVAADAAGDFVVVWESEPQDGSSRGVFGQRFSAIVPVDLMHFRVE